MRESNVLHAIPTLSNQASLSLIHSFVAKIQKLLQVNPDKRTLTKVCRIEKKILLG